MITAVFNDKMDYTIAYGLWQWDYGQVLRVKGLDFNQISIEVHFSLSPDNTDSLVTIGVVKDIDYQSTIVSDGEEYTVNETATVLDVVIPKDMLWNNIKKNYIIYAFLYLSNMETGYTIKKVVLPVKSRAKPSYIHSAKDEEMFHSTIEQINDIYEDIKAQTDPVIESLEGWEDLKKYIEDFKGTQESDTSTIGAVWTKTENGAEFRPVSAQGSFDYETTTNKPRIESVELVGNKTFSDLGFEECTNEDILAMFRE